MDNNELVWTPKETAQKLKISERKLWDMTQKGEIKARKLGRKVVYIIADIKEFINGLASVGSN